jgi:hypothetical protein
MRNEGGWDRKEYLGLQASFAIQPPAHANQPERRNENQDEHGITDSSERKVLSNHAFAVYMADIIYGSEDLWRHKLKSNNPLTFVLSSYFT